MKKIFILTEEDKKEVLNNYFGEPSRKFYDFLKSNITVETYNGEWSNNPFVLIYVDGKSRLLSNSKKYLVNVIVNAYGDDFPDINEASKRLTTKKYIDDLKKFYFYEEN